MDAWLLENEKCKDLENSYERYGVLEAYLAVLKSMVQNRDTSKKDNLVTTSSYQSLDTIMTSLLFRFIYLLNRAPSNHLFIDLRFLFIFLTPLRWFLFENEKKTLMTSICFIR